MSFRLTVSVIIVTHNRSDLLQNAVSSVERQTLRPLELIVVDDCSEVLSSKKNSEICNGSANYIYLPGRHGAQYARNYGAKLASADILCFLDDDDEFVDIKLENITRIFEQYVSLGAISNSFLVKRKNRLLKVVHTTLKEKTSELLIENTLGGCSMLSIRRSLFLKLNGFSEDLKSCQDWDFWIKTHIASNIQCIKEPLTIYNVIEGKRVSTDFRKSLLGRRKLFLKYRGLMSKETRIWHLFVMASLKCGLKFSFSNVFKSFCLLVYSRRFIYGGAVLFSILKRAINKSEE